MTTVVLQTQRDCLGLYTPTGPTELDHIWSKGQTIDEYQPRIPDWRVKDPAEMSLRELIESQNQELPSISRVSWERGLGGTLSTDRPSSSDDDGTTLASIIEPIAEKLGFQTTKPKDAMDEAELAAYEAFCAERASEYTGLTPYVTTPPDLLSRIEWEQKRYLSSDPIKLRLQKTVNSVRVMVIGAKLTEDQYAQVSKKYLQRLIDAGWTKDQILNAGDRRTEKAKVAEVRAQALDEIEDGWYEEVYLGKYHLDVTPQRDEFLDLDLHGGHEAIEELSEEEEEEREQMQAMGLPLEPIPVYIRGLRNPLEAMSPVAKERALWHGTIGQMADIGTHDLPQDWWETEDDLMPIIPKDNTGVGALAGLTN